jgi:cytochrome b
MIVVPYFAMLVRFTMTERANLFIRIWDLPTRLFHWALALAVVGSIVTARIGGNAMEWHFLLGYCIFTLLAFRLLWGIVGGRWSRFSTFLFAPATLLRYLRGQQRAGELLEVGHNPLGSLSVFALLGILILQVATGLVADDDISNVGPFNRFVSASLAARASSWHHGPGQWLIIGLVSMHVAAVLYYVVRKKRNVIRPMLDGDKQVPHDTPASLDGLRQRALAALLFALCAGVLAWLLALAG